jgi:hypothetical protein
MGARYWNLHSKLDLDLPPVLPDGVGLSRKVENTESWADWVLGARLISDITSHVGLGLSANVGGFNIANSSKFTYEIATGVRFTVWRHLRLDLGYRATRRSCAQLRDSQIGHRSCRWAARSIRNVASSKQNSTGTT